MKSFWVELTWGVANSYRKTCRRSRDLVQAWMMSDERLSTEFPNNCFSGARKSLDIDEDARKLSFVSNVDTSFYYYYYYRLRFAAFRCSCNNLTSSLSRKYTNCIIYVVFISAKLFFCNIGLTHSPNQKSIPHRCSSAVVYDKHSLVHSINIIDVIIFYLNRKNRSLFKFDDIHSGLGFCHLRHRAEGNIKQKFFFCCFRDWSARNDVEWHGKRSSHRPREQKNTQHENK